MPATEDVTAKELRKTRQAMCDILGVAAKVYSKDPAIKIQTDGAKIQIGPLLTDWATIDAAVASKEKFHDLLSGLFEAVDLMEAKKAKLPRRKTVQRVTPGGGARWSPR